MKKIFLSLSILTSGLLLSQVGINSTVPKATLDIVGKSGNVDIDGVIAPRLTRAQLTAKGNLLYGANQNGAIIYITDVSAGDILSQRVNITAPGYYYFDSAANVWKKFTSKDEIPNEPWNVTNSITPASANSQNIYQMGRVGIFNNDPLNILHLKSSSSLASGIGNTNYVQGMITTGDAFPGAYIELNKSTISGSRVLKQWVEEQTYSGIPRGVYQWQVVSDNAQSVNKQLLKADMLSGDIGIGPVFQSTTSAPQVKLDVDGNVFARTGLSIGQSVADNYTASSDSWLNVGGIAGSTKPIARFSINNCGSLCAQKSASNVVFNNTNYTNSEYASLAFIAKGGHLTDFTPATEILGIDRDASNNYGGLSIRTRNAANFGDRFLVRSSGRVEIKDVGTSADNTLTKILAVNSSGQVGYVDKEIGSARFVTGAFETLDLSNVTRSNLKSIYFHSHGAVITLPKSSPEMAGVEIEFFISMGAADSQTTGLSQEFSVSIDATDLGSNSFIYNASSVNPYSSLISSWTNSKITFVNNINRAFRSLKFKLVSNGVGTYRWIFVPSGV